ncbi:MAG: hypothetical protein ACM336_11765 [Acidobacteriota bacterium]
MSLRVVAWALVAAMAAGGVLLLNYWAAYQPLSTLAYTGFVVALAGLANLIIPFRFLGVRKRFAGALVLAAGVAMSYAALYWPAPLVHAAGRKTVIDCTMPDYQFSERHSTRIHARPERVMQAVREATFGDMKSLATLMKIREVVVRAPASDVSGWRDKRILESFASSGYISGGSEREIGLFGPWNAKTNRRPDVHTLQEFAAYREPGAVKMGFYFNVEDTGGGWSKITAETRVAAPGGNSQGLARYWRLIVPGSGLLRLQWLEGIKRRAESAPAVTSSLRRWPAIPAERFVKSLSENARRA